QYRIMDGTNFNGPGFLKLIQWFIELNIDMYRTFVFSQGILERLIDLEVKIPRLMDRPFVYIITGFDVISIYVLLSNRLSVPLINQMRRSICGKNHKGNILIIGFDNCRTIMEQCRARCTVENDGFAEFHSNIQCKKSCGSFIRN